MYRQVNYNKFWHIQLHDYFVRNNRGTFAIVGVCLSEMATAGNTQKDVWGGSYFGNLDFWTKATATTNGRHRCRSSPRPDTPVFFELRRRPDVRRISANKPAASAGKNIWSRSNSCRWVIWRHYRRGRWKKKEGKWKREKSPRVRGGFASFSFLAHSRPYFCIESDVTANTITSISLVVTH